LKTAIDSSVLYDLFIRQGNKVAAGRAIRHFAREGDLVACEVVWAEMAGHLQPARRLADVMLRLGILFEALDQTSAQAAGRAWRSYRRQDGPRDRILPDFLIAAHAMVQADQLLTRDEGFRRSHFAGLRVVEP
jgi:predicted nucleic acid-binding protein